MRFVAVASLLVSLKLSVWCNLALNIITIKTGCYVVYTYSRSISVPTYYVNFTVTTGVDM